MPRRRPLVALVPIALAVPVAALLLAGLGLALTGRFGDRLGPPPAAARTAGPRAGDRLEIVALGDSLTAGTGDPRGGYAVRVAEALRARGRSVSLTNLAVPGAESADVGAGLERPETARLLAAADLVLVSAGGNDLAHALRGRLGRGGGRASGREPVREEGAAFAAARGAPAAEAPPEEAEPDEALPLARANLSAIVARVRAANPRAPIRLLGLYNPFEVAPDAQATARAQLLPWNVAIEEAAFPHGDALAVPIADLFEGAPERLAGDRFHPGPRGHELMAERVLSTLPRLEAERGGR